MQSCVEEYCACLAARQGFKWLHNQEKRVTVYKGYRRTCSFDRKWETSQSTIFLHPKMPVK